MDAEQIAALRHDLATYHMPPDAVSIHNLDGLVAARERLAEAVPALLDAIGPWVVVTGPDDCCGREPVALFSSRAKAQAFVDEHDAAVKRAEADGAHGCCHKGDYEIADVPIDPASVRDFIDKRLYLWKYLDHG